ncbi:unnamed protein product [Meganyctiphanes norvegica]|uniref:Uncharacterized protein n=1 Tax=Meganyctiphanes norvegica TaxID=48144 RepID=A0AAV2PJW2_MEGNR
MLRQVLQQVQVLWPAVDVHVAVDGTQSEESSSIVANGRVHQHMVSCQKWKHSDLQSLAASITTPFTLVLEGIAAVTGDVNLPRLIQQAENFKSLGVAVLGGSERGHDGTWDYTCTQLVLNNYHLELKEGYDFSRQTCLFCDVTSSSFLAATWVLKEVPYDPVLTRKSQTLDWSLQLHHRGILSMTCPDMMFHVNRNMRPREQHYEERDRPCVTKEEKKQAKAQLWTIKRQYRKVAQKWELNFIHFSNGTNLEYNCREIHFDCQANTKVKHYVLPPCCLKIKYKMFDIVDIIAKESKIPYQIGSGTLLGAVKFKDGLPWDFDDDASYHNSDMGKFKRSKQRMRRLGVSPAFSNQTSKLDPSIISKYIYMTGQGGFTFDLWGVKELPSAANMESLTEIPGNLVCFQYGNVAITIKAAIELQKNMSQTNQKNPHPVSCYLHSSVRVGTNWLPAPWNPALVALQKYGHNMYRHEPHWRFTGSSDPYKFKSSMKYPKTWLPPNQSPEHSTSRPVKTGWPRCPRPGHPACLDIHPMDGSIPFV